MKKRTHNYYLYMYMSMRRWDARLYPYYTFVLFKQHSINQSINQSINHMYKKYREKSLKIPKR